MKRIKKYIPMLFILILTITISVSFGWFVFNNDLTIKSNDNFNIKVSNYLTLAYLKQDGTWSDYGDQFSFTTTKLVDITSDGQNFGYPFVLDRNDNAVFPLVKPSNNKMTALGSNLVEYSYDQSSWTTYDEEDGLSLYYSGIDKDAGGNLIHTQEFAYIRHANYGDEGYDTIVKISLIDQSYELIATESDSVDYNFITRIKCGKDGKYYDGKLYIDGYADYEGYYIEMYFKVKSDIYAGVYLSDESYIHPHGYTSDDVIVKENESVYGKNKFSSNYIAGASRVYFGEIVKNTANTDMEIGRQVWIPNPNYEFSADGQVYNINGTPESSYGYLLNDYTAYDPLTGDSEGNIVSYTYDTKDYYKRNIVIGNDLANRSGYVCGTKPIVSFNGVEAEKTFVVRIWIEGTDREANSALNQGVIDINIQLIGVEKREEKQEDIDSVSEVFRGETVDDFSKLFYLNDELETIPVEVNKLEYSYNGKTWSSYDPSVGLPYYYDSITKDPETLQLIHTTQSVYLRRKEIVEKDFRTIVLLDLQANTGAILYDYRDSSDNVNDLENIMVGDGTGSLALNKLYYSDSSLDITNSTYQYSYDGKIWNIYKNTSGLLRYYEEGSLVNTTETVYIKNRDYDTICKIDLVTNTKTIIYTQVEMGGGE